VLHQEPPHSAQQRRGHRARLAPVAQPVAETDLLGDLACPPGCGVPRDTSAGNGSRPDGMSRVRGRGRRGSGAARDWQFA
jgi:hypothetical protein